MTTIQKAKEIFLAAWEYWRISAVESPSLTFDNWTKTDEGKQLLSGEDWKEDGNDAIRFLDEIRDYEHESGKRIYEDERTSEELYQLFKSSQNLNQ